MKKMNIITKNIIHTKMIINKNAPIVNVDKQIFVCNDVNGIPDNITDRVSIACESPANFSSFLQHQIAANINHVTMKYVHL